MDKNMYKLILAYIPQVKLEKENIKKYKKKDIKILEDV